MFLFERKFSLSLHDLESVLDLTMVQISDSKLSNDLILIWNVWLVNLHSMQISRFWSKIHPILILKGNISSGTEKTNRKSYEMDELIQTKFHFGSKNDQFRRISGLSSQCQIESSLLWSKYHNFWIRIDSYASNPYTNQNFRIKIRSWSERYDPKLWPKDMTQRYDPKVWPKGMTQIENWLEMDQFWIQSDILFCIQNFSITF